MFGKKSIIKILEGGVLNQKIPEKLDYSKFNVT